MAFSACRPGKPSWRWPWSCTASRSWARPFWRTRPVDIGRLFLYAVLSYSVITEGASLMQEVEAWRSEAGGYMYEVLAGEGGSVNLDIPGGATSNEPIYNPRDLDGRPPVRGWEAVASSYFLANSADELHQGVPPHDFRREYCLYDPARAIDEQNEENGQGCSPAKAWDEWDLVSTGVITEVWGFPLPIDIGISIPIVQEHPENRQLAIRQAQEGLARLALGPVVALFPLLEANVELMLTLSASFIYLSLPIVMLFGFFMYTEPLVNRLLLQLLNVMIRTLILNGLIALFLMLLIGVSVNGSLMTYLGLIGVGLLGGFFLGKIATGTMRETLSQSLGAVGNLWLGAATGSLGEGARQPAQAALGGAKWLGAGAMLGAGGMYAYDLWDTARQTARSGSQDLRRGSPEAAAIGQQAYQAAGQLPAPLARMAQYGLADLTAPPETTSSPLAVPAPLAQIGQLRSSASARQKTYTEPEVPPPLATGGSPALAASANGYQPAYQPSDQSSSQPSPRFGTYMGEPGRVEAWAGQVYETRDRGQEAGQLVERGQEILGQELSQQAYRAMARHSRDETMAVLRASRQAAAGGVDQLIRPDGGLNEAGIERIRSYLDPATLESFRGQQGEQDLSVLAAAGLQPQQRARPEEFRQAAAGAREWQGDEAAGRAVPRRLGLDAVSTGAHFAALNRFTRLSEQAGLSEEQRRQLLNAARQEGQIPASLRRTIESSLRQQQERGLAGGLKAEDLISSARSLPETLDGPLLVRLPESLSDRVNAGEPGAGQTDPARARPSHQPAGQVKSELARELKNESRRRGRSEKKEAGKNGMVRPAVPSIDRQVQGEGAGAGSDRSGQVQAATSRMLEEADIKNKAAGRKGRREAATDSLPSLKQLDDEALGQEPTNIKPETAAGARAAHKKQAAPSSTRTRGNR